MSNPTSQSQRGSQPALPDAVTPIQAAVSTAQVMEGVGTTEGPNQTSPHDTGARERVGKRYITLVVLAALGAYVALVTPIALTLALRVEQLAPGRPEILGYITGIGAIAALLTTPVMGMLSDRTRSRLGRRRPYLIGGVALGTIALALTATAPNVIVLGGAWVLAQLGWGATVLPTLVYSQADRLPEEQRGKVSGLVGFVQNFGPVIGAGIASTLIGNNLAVFLVPGAIGVLFLALFVIFVDDDPNPALVNTDRLNIPKFLRSFVFSPRQYPDFAWNSLGRMIFNLGLSFATTFTTFFFAARAGVAVRDIGGIVVILSIGGVVCGALGALGGGLLSDRLKRRRVFVLVAAVLFTAGALIMSFATALPVIITGSLIMSLGVGLFASVDQAIVLDILPERDTDAGRFIGINNYSTMLPQAVGPLLASAILVVGATGADKNYTLLFLVAAAFTIIGGLVVVTRVRSIR